MNDKTIESLITLIRAVESNYKQAIDMHEYCDDQYKDFYKAKIEALDEVMHYIDQLKSDMEGDDSDFN